MNFKQLITPYENFPKPGIIFWDFSKLLQNTKAFLAATDIFCDYFKDHGITKIAAIEAKGFTIGTAIAYRLKKPLILIRKPGLIPGKVAAQKFTKEYGIGEYQIAYDSFSQKDRVLIVYDIMAGPGATKAAISLVEKQHAQVVGCSYVIELEYLHGRKQLLSYDPFSLVKISSADMNL